MNHDELLDQAAAAVRDEPLDVVAREAAVDRVRRRLAAAHSGGAAEPESDEHRIRGCEGFRALLPAHRAGALAANRRLLLEDHLRECVPCRRALRELERGGPAAPPAAAPVRRGPVAGRRWLLAAAAAGVAITGGALWYVTGGAVAPPSAEVRALEGELFALRGDRVEPVAAGAVVAEGTPVRTAAGSRAVLALADGSRLELAPRSEITLDRRRDGVVVELGRGNVIVEAAEQRRGRLYVRTDDCLVSVVGTIFTVAHGTRGSRVSVLDGEVRVRHGAELAVLRPGDQVATSERLDRVPLEREIAWSRNADAYRDRIAALAELGRTLDRAFEVPAERTSTRLLDLAPAGTVIYAALPDVSERLAEAWSELEQRAAENPALAEWWRDHGTAELSEGLEKLRTLGGHLGDELVVALASTGDGGEPEAVVLAEIHDRRGLEETIDRELAALVREDGAGARVRRVEDPATAAGDGRELLVWLAPGDVFVASPSAARLREVAAALGAGGSGFVGTPFHRRLAEVYGRGAAWLLAFDAGRLIAGERPDGDDAEALAASGFAALDHVVLESVSDDGVAENRAEVAFAGTRRGVASWLAEPGPSGALEFVSPAAAVAVGGLLKDPVEMFDDLVGLAGRGHSDIGAKLTEIESDLGVSLREDLAAALGGDVAFAIDGPWLPMPSWKAVVEVVDADRLAAALDRLTESWNRHHAGQGGVTRLVWREELSGGRVFRTLAAEGRGDLVHLLFADGYLLAGPSRALLAEAVTSRAAGVTLPASAAFLEALPSGAETDLSAVAWQNLAASAGDLGRLLDGALDVPEAERERLWALVGDAGPMLAVAVAESDRVRLAARGGRGPLGLSLGSLFALFGLAEEGAAAYEVPEAAAPAAETPVRAAA
jgi:ferric-dicitrate binding protein FerR (iron transport regulator)